MGEAATAVEFAHSLGEVVAAVADAGLRVEVLREHLDGDADYRGDGVLVQGGDGRWHLRLGGQDLPVLFSLRAAKPG